MKIKIEPNEICNLIKKPCIEDECEAFARSRMMTPEERKVYAMADNPLCCSGILSPIRWCNFYQKSIALILSEDDDKDIK